MNKQLNASCNFQNGLLVCKLTGDAVEVVLKVKTRWEKCTLHEDSYSGTEKFHPWDRADRRVRINTRRWGMPRCTQDPNSNNNDTKGDSVESTDSGMYKQTSKAFSYHPFIFTDPEHAILTVILWMV